MVLSFNDCCNCHGSSDVPLCWELQSILSFVLTSSPVFPFLIFLLLVTLNNTLLLEVPAVTDSFCIDSLYVR